MKNKSLDIVKSRAFSSLLPFLVLVVLLIFFNIASGGRFLAGNSIKLMFNQTIITGIVATGGVFVFASNNVNIALGSTTAISAIVAVFAYNYTGSAAAMFVMAVITAVGILMISCVASTIFNIGVVIVTIIMSNLLSALQKWIMLKYVTLSLPYELTAAMSEKRIHIIIFAVFLLVCIYIFNMTQVGRMLRFIGENSICARQTGFHVSKNIYIAFLMAGIAAGLGAILYLIRNGSVAANSCSSTNMDVMLAIVLGGMPINGGYKSKIAAGIWGASIVTCLSTGLLMIGVSATVLQAVRGVCFIGLIIASNKRTELLPVKQTV